MHTPVHRIFLHSMFNGGANAPRFIRVEYTRHIVLCVNLHWLVNETMFGDYLAFIPWQIIIFRVHAPPIDSTFTTCCSKTKLLKCHHSVGGLGHNQNKHFLFDVECEWTEKETPNIDLQILPQLKRKTSLAKAMVPVNSFDFH